jgi:hypothetical protein
MKYLDIPLALGVAAAAAYGVGLETWTEISVELVSLLSILGMGALTAAIVLLTVKSPEELNVGEARAIGTAWHGLALRLSTVLVCAILGVASIVAGRVFLGDTVLTFETANLIIREDFQWAVSGLIALFATLAVTRLMSVLHGIVALSKTNRELVVKGVLRHQSRVADQSEGRIETLKLPGDTERLFKR